MHVLLSTNSNTGPAALRSTRILASYALALICLAGASGQARGAVIYSGVLNQAVVVGTSFKIDFNGGGNDVSFNLTKTGTHVIADVRGLSSSSFVASGWSTGWPNTARNLPAGHDFAGYWTRYLPKNLYEYSDSSSLIRGDFPLASGGFVGVRIDGADNGVNGVAWVRLATGNSPTDAYQVVDWAFSDSASGSFYRYKSSGLSSVDPTVVSPGAGGSTTGFSYFGPTAISSYGLTDIAYGGPIASGSFVVGQTAESSDVAEPRSAALVTAALLLVAFHAWVSRRRRN